MAGGDEQAPAGWPPRPAGARTLGELSEQLRMLHAWSGLSYREIHRRMVRSRRARGVVEVPSLDTVYRCLRPGRTRLDVELLVDIADTLLGDRGHAAEWRLAYQAVTGRAEGAAIVTVRRGLPAADPAFVGRRTELDRLVREPMSGGVLVTSVEGMAGIGKTTFAVQAAHELVALGRFAGPRLTVDLRGHDPDRPPADPGAVLAAVLQQLGCSPHQVHALDLRGRVARYRELLAGGGGLLLLDDAAGDDQVRPLLPPVGSGWLALVTSRRRLPGLPVLQLGVLTGDESVELLRRIGGPVVDADPHVARRIADRVGRLPLALALVGSRLRRQRRWTLLDHLERVDEQRHLLAIDGPVEVSLGLTYATLSEGARRLLRLLASHPGRDYDGYAAAAMVGIGVEDGVPYLDELVAANAVRRRAADRYELHDLVRIFVARQARDEDAPSWRRAALDRLFGYYRRVARTAMALYSPADQPPAGVDRGTVSVPVLADRAAATAWLEAERADLVACALYAAEHGQAAVTLALSTTLHRFLDQAGHYHDALVLHRRASQVAEGPALPHALSRYAVACMRVGWLDEARDHYLRALALAGLAGDRGAEGKIIVNLGIVNRRLGRYDEAIENYRRGLSIEREAGNDVTVGRITGYIGYVQVLRGHRAEGIESLEQAIALARACGDRAGEAVALGNLGVAAQNAGDHEAALALQGQAIDLLRDLGDRANEGMALNLRGLAFASLGRPREALEHHHGALALAREVGDPDCEADALNGVADALRALGDLDAALDRDREALAVATSTGNRGQQASSHDGIARTSLAVGDPAAARQHWRQALALYSELDRPEAGTVAARLAELDDLTSRRPRTDPVV